MRPDRRPLPIIAALAGACLAPAAILAADGIVDGSRSVCTHPEAALPRIVQVIYEDPDSPVPCKVLYEKDGAVKEIAAARNSGGHCEKTERKVVRNLAAGGYDCRHTFMGALASADRSVTLDLFSGGTAAYAAEAGSASPPGADTGRDPVDAGETDDRAVASARTGDDGESSGPSDAPDPIAGAETRFEDGAHEHTFTHAHPVEPGSDVAVRHTHATVLLAVASDGADTGTVPLAGGSDVSGEGDPEDRSPPAPIAARAPTARPAASPPDRDVPAGRLAILSRPLSEQSEAHRFAAEFRRNFPNVETRVASRGDGAGPWHVALGTGDDEAALAGALGTLGTDAATLFEVAALDAAAPLRYARDDWARYAIASCYADGRRTAEEFADCASVVVDAEAFVDCLGGGLCAPPRAGANQELTAIDLAFVLASDDPVAAARRQVLDRVAGCERADAEDDAAFAECAALAVLDDDHRAVYDCYERSPSDLALLECAGGDKVADYARAYDRCGTSGYDAAACLLDNSGNDYLESAGYCLAYEDAADIATCSLEANLADDDALVLACLTDYRERTERAVCLARERLDDTEYAAVECATLADSVTDYGLCIGERDGSLSAETLHAARCLQGADIAADTLLDCAGGQFVGEDIRGCLEHGIEDPRCFDPETLMSRVAGDAVDDYLKLASLDNEIARFRQELYALEGGDLGQILASEGGAASLKVVDDAAKKASGGLRGLFGLKPR